MKITKSEFLGSAVSEKQYPDQSLPEIAFAGRSNVGKSSLLNLITSRKKLAKKNLDMIAANNLKVEGAGFKTDTNVLTLITREGETALELMGKEEAADHLLSNILCAMQK